MENQKQIRGFALMNKERLKEVASKAGKRSHELRKGHQFTTEEAKLAGRKGGIEHARRWREKNKKGEYAVETETVPMSE